MSTNLFKIISWLFNKQIIAISLCFAIHNRPSCTIVDALTQLFGLLSKIDSAKVIQESFQFFNTCKVG